MCCILLPTQFSLTRLSLQLYFHKDLSPPDSSEVTTTLILGLIKQAHIHETVLAADGSSVDPSKLRPIARLGGLTYARILEGFDLDRPSWKDTKATYDRLEGTASQSGSS